MNVRKLIITVIFGMKYYTLFPQGIQFGSIAQSCPTLCDPMDCSTPGFSVLTNSQSFLKLMSIESVISSNHLNLCHPLLLPPLIFPSIRVFSNELVLRIRYIDRNNTNDISTFSFLDISISVPVTEAYFLFLVSC